MTSEEEESDPVEDKTDEDEDSINNESSKDLSNADTIRFHTFLILVLEKLTPCCSLMVLSICSKLMPNPTIQHHYEIVLPVVFRLLSGARSSLVVKLTDTCQSCRELGTSTAESLHIGGRYTINLSRRKLPPVGVVGKLGKG
ncbi:hypothetical protein TNCV_1862781 [Trichonephila clavipes]|nr:hypothetical protein TNCV_1862781 [Trichonephila clavipes]